MAPCTFRARTFHGLPQLGRSIFSKMAYPIESDLRLFFFKGDGVGDHIAFLKKARFFGGSSRRPRSFFVDFVKLSLFGQCVRSQSRSLFWGKWLEAKVVLASPKLIATSLLSLVFGGKAAKNKRKQRWCLACLAC